MVVQLIAEDGVEPRQRLLQGLAEAVREKGYRDTTVADVVARARTSRRTFYESFPSKDECFVALLAALNEQLRARIVAAVDPEAPWDEQVRSAVQSWVATLAAEPELSVSWIRELPSLGARAVAVQREALRALTLVVIAATSTPGMRRAGVRPVAPATATILLGGLRELVAGVIEEGGDLAGVLEPAVDAAMALLGPRATDRTCD